MSISFQEYMLKLLNYLLGSYFSLYGGAESFDEEDKCKCPVNCQVQRQVLFFVLFIYIYSRCASGTSIW